MPVSVADVCAVLSHEMRTPLGVLQGYLRLLETSAVAPSTTVFGAMLDATSQLATLGRQASALHSSLERTSDVRPLALPQLVQCLGQLQPSHRVVLETDVAARTITTTGDGAALAGALAAVADAVAREAESAFAVVTLAAADGGNIRIDVRAEPSLPAGERPAASRAWFLQGGQGLRLLGAAVTLDAHGVSVEVIAGGHLRLLVPTRHP